MSDPRPGLFFLHVHRPYSLDDPIPGSGFDPDQVRRALGQVGPDAVHYTVKGQSGYVAYPTHFDNGLVSEEMDGWGDVLAAYREITREMGIPLFVGYSGLIDARAGSHRPDWQRVASNYSPYPNRALCPNAGYVDDLMMPQLAEILERYDPDGIWVDGDNWTVSPCYCSVCASEYQMMHERSAPVERSDPKWREWLEFHRESFERYLSRVTRFVRDRKESLVYATNGGYCTHQPEIVPRNVNRLTWDLSPAYSLRQAGLEARFTESQAVSYDLVTWTRCSARPQAQGRAAALPSYPKTAEHLQQEGSVITANGAGWGIAITAYADDSLPESEFALAAKAAAFVRERETWLRDTRSASYVAILHSETTHARAGNGLYDPGPCLDRIRGAHQIFTELHHPHDVLTWAPLSGSLARYSVIVLPEQIALPPEVDEMLTEWVFSGGCLVVSGRVSPRIMEDIPTFAMQEALGVTWTGRQRSEGWVQHRGLPLRLVAPICEVALDDAEMVAPLLRSGHETRQESLGIPAVTRKTLGEGEVYYIAADLFTAYHRSQYPGLREIVADLLAQAMPLSPFTTTAAPSVEMTLRLKGRELILHAVDHSPGKSLAQNSAFIESVPRNEGFQVGMAIPDPPVSVRLQPEGTEPEWSYADQVLSVTVPPFHIHTMLVVEEAEPKTAASAEPS